MKQTLKTLPNLRATDQAKGPDQVDLVPRHRGRRIERFLEPLEEISDRLVQQRRELEQPACRDANFTLLVFLHDLEAHRQFPADIRLRQAGELAREPQLAANMDIDRVGAMLLGRISAAPHAAENPRFRHGFEQVRSGTMNSRTV